ncbi:hypothetical protein C1646_751757 [Rhizophagus diaphanus]|nr:hypothetical protein C1646_751757 [Rhizophagus diaphanus] [Rhizophagus sp. MUCL 43196]
MEAIGVHKFSAIITDTASVMKSAWRANSCRLVALKLFESDTSIISTVYFHFKKLMNQVSEFSCNFSNIQQFIQKRWKYLYHPVMMAAYILDLYFLEKSRNTDMKESSVIQKGVKKKFTHNQINLSNDNNKNKDNDVNDEDNDNKMFRLELNIADLTTE